MLTVIMLCDLWSELLRSWTLTTMMWRSSPVLAACSLAFKYCWPVTTRSPSGRTLYVLFDDFSCVWSCLLFQLCVIFFIVWIVCDLVYCFRCMCSFLLFSLWFQLFVILFVVSIVCDLVYCFNCIWSCLLFQLY